MSKDEKPKLIKSEVHADGKSIFTGNTIYKATAVSEDGKVATHRSDDRTFAQKKANYDATH